MQTKKLSLVEAITNTAVGLAVSMATREILVNHFGVIKDVAGCLAIIAFVASSYVVRRMFARMQVKVYKRIPVSGPESLDLDIVHHKLGWRQIIKLNGDKMYMSLNYHSKRSGALSEAINIFCKPWVLSCVDEEIEAEENTEEKDGDA